MCDKPVTEDPCLLKYVPDNFKKQKMCNKAVKKIHIGLAKNARPKKKKEKKKFCPVPGIHQDDGTGVSLTMKKKEQKNCGHKHGSFCILLPVKKLTLAWVQVYE